METASMSDRILAVHRSLEEAEIPHAFGGAIALAFHTSSPRATNDIDVNIALPSTEAERVFRSLPPQVKWSSQRLRIAEIQAEVKLRWLRSGPVDLFFAKSEFYELVEQRKELHYFSGSRIPVISATDLTVFKAIFNRDQDWVDIAAMLQADTVDITEALRWTEAVGGAEAATRLQRSIERYRTDLKANGPTLSGPPDTPVL